MNRLRGETSPYLQQHAENPVDWYPWGPEALAQARALDKPILLSIGYAACHWCHVMAHESFEDPATAQVMNERFINIKVDREERPELDSIYMQAVQALTGQGGWPMTVFLTPDGVPFYGGTYFPPKDRHGLPAFSRILLGVAEAYRTQRDRVESTGNALLDIFKSAQQRLPSGAPTLHGLERAFRGLAVDYDERHAGFGGAPKFPPSMALHFLLVYWARTHNEKALEIVRETFLAMLRGGIYDQVGGGLHRYAVDDRWLVPHFEKMLYDNALFVRLGTALWQATKHPEAKRAVEETIRWVAKEMTSPAGGFFSSLDADSEGREGRFYVWDEAEIRGLVGEDAQTVLPYWGVTSGGNFEGKNILFVPAPGRVVAQRLGQSEHEMNAAVTRARSALYEARSHRVWPGRDEKILTSWNAYMLRAVADAARVFDNTSFQSLAVANAEFLWRELVVDGRAFRTHRDGRSKGTGYLEDQAGLGLALLEVYALTLDRQWLDRAVQLTRIACEAFYDRSAALFFDTAADHETLITRPRDVTDNATPSGQSLIVELLLRVAEYTDDSELRKLGEDTLLRLNDAAITHPLAFGQLLSAADLAINGAIQVVLASGAGVNSVTELQRAVSQHFVPSLILAGRGTELDAGLALLEGKEAIGGLATAYVCRRYRCDAPTHHAEELATQLQRAILPQT